jgi:hypoxanthine-DNA glycosylase
MPAMSAPGDPPDALPLREGLPPLVDARTRLVVLGSFPGQASLRAGEYYGHPRNQFWPLVAAVLGGPPDLRERPYAQRCAWLLAQGVGLWDVHAACRRPGSLDADIRDAVPNDLTRLIVLAPGLRALAHHGGESARAMRRSAALGLPVFRLPSSSPANAGWSFERKHEAWRRVFMDAGVV